MQRNVNGSKSCKSPNRPQSAFSIKAVTWLLIIFFISSSLVLNFNIVQAKPLGYSGGFENNVRWETLISDNTQSEIYGTISTLTENETIITLWAFVRKTSAGWMQTWHNELGYFSHWWAFPDPTVSFAIYEQSVDNENTWNKIYSTPSITIWGYSGEWFSYDTSGDSLVLAENRTYALCVKEDNNWTAGVGGSSGTSSNSEVASIELSASPTDENEFWVNNYGNEWVSSLTLGSRGTGWNTGGGAWYAGRGLLAYTDKDPPPPTPNPAVITSVTCDNNLIDRKKDDNTFSTITGKTRIAIDVRDNDGRENIFASSVGIYIRDSLGNVVVNGEHPDENSAENIGTTGNLTLSNGFEDNEISQWTFTKFPTNWAEITYGNSADNKVYGDKEGFMAIATKYTLGVAMSANMSISFASQTYVRAEWWMKYTGESVPNDPAHYSPHGIFITMGGNSQRFIYWFDTVVNYGLWCKYRAVITSSHIAIYRLDNDAWVNIFESAWGGMSGDLGFRIDSADSNNTDYGITACFDGLQIFDSPSDVGKRFYYTYDPVDNLDNSALGAFTTQVIVHDYPDTWSENTWGWNSLFTVNDLNVTVSVDKENISEGMPLTVRVHAQEVWISGDSPANYQPCMVKFIDPLGVVAYQLEGALDENSNFVFTTVLTEGMYQYGTYRVEAIVYWENHRLDGVGYTSFNLKVLHLIKVETMTPTDTDATGLLVSKSNKDENVILKLFVYDQEGRLALSKQTDIITVENLSKFEFFQIHYGITLAEGTYGYKLEVWSPDLSFNYDTYYAQIRLTIGITLATITDWYVVSSKESGNTGYYDLDIARQYLLVNPTVVNKENYLFLEPIPIPSLSSITVNIGGTLTSAVVDQSGLMTKPINMPANSRVSILLEAVYEHGMRIEWAQGSVVVATSPSLQKKSEATVINMTAQFLRTVKFDVPLKNVIKVVDDEGREYEHYANENTGGTIIVFTTMQEDARVKLYFTSEVPQSTLDILKKLFGVTLFGVPIWILAGIVGIFLWLIARRYDKHKRLKWYTQIAIVVTPMIVALVITFMVA